MQTFKPGTRVVHIETGLKGVVRKQFIDGYVSVDLEGDRPAELAASRLCEDPRAAEEPRNR
ncbi:MAG TPA: hypothetical protein VGK89_01150 [Candidatus Eisenbacteria bacterium]|jgi:hypothetical protein